MKIHIAGLHLLDDKALAEIKGAAANAGHEVVEFGVNELEKAVEAAKTTEIGTAVVAAIHAVDEPGLSGAEKMVRAIDAVAPTIVTYIARGGFGAVIADVEQFARHIIESTLADLKKTKTAEIAAAVLKIAA